MQQGPNTKFTSDRFGRPNSSLNLNGGYTVVPPGVYLNSPVQHYSLGVSFSQLDLMQGS